MLRYLMAAIAATAFLLAACGGDDARPAASPAGAASPASPAAAPTSNGLQQPAGDEKPLPTAPPLAPDEVALTVVNGKKNFAPTARELNALATTTVKGGEQSYTGISVAALGEKVGAAPASYALIEGIRADGKRQGIVRYLLSEIGSTTVLVPDAAGHLTLASSSIPKDLWIVGVTSVAFQ
jgi:hypothetical protein